LDRLPPVLAEARGIAPTTPEVGCFRGWVSRYLQRYSEDSVTVESLLCDCPRCRPADDLVERLVQAAEAAIRNERPSLEHKVGAIRGITLELRIANNGTVIDGTCYVERGVSVGRLLAMQATERDVR
jgi:hypothetical protein